MFAFGRTPHDYLLLPDSIVIEGVQGLPVLQHDVIGDINDVVDRTLAAGYQSLL